jgi:type I restriction enzyme S subunit
MSTVEGWKKESLSRVAQINMGQSPDSKYYSEEKNGLPFLQGCAEFTGRFPKNVLYCSQTKKVALAGSILFSVRAPVGKINVADQDYIIGRGLAAISGVDVDQTYLEHYLKYEASSFRNASQGSTFEAINSSELNKWPIEYPTSKPEQAKIAEILSTVDRAIEQTEALIAKQQRIKTGLMQDLLTRGIDEHGNLRTEQTHKFKDSPLGRIPVEWEVKTLDSCVRNDGPICYGILMPGSGYDNGVPVIKVKDIVGGKILQNNLLLTDPKIDSQYKRSKLRGGDLLITIRGTTGRVAIVPSVLDGANITQDTARIRLKGEYSNIYFYFLLQSKHVQDQVLLHTLGQAVKGINIAEVKKLSFGLPALNEQRMIAERLNEMEESLDSTDHELNKFNAIKTALMQDLLTGRKQVTQLLNSEKTTN